MDDKTDDRDQKRFKIQSALFLTGVTGASIVFGFAMTLAMARKKDPNMFQKGLLPTKDMPESGGSLAVRALAWGTFYSVTGFGIFCFAACKMMGVHNMKEFREKMQSVMPTIPKREPQGKSDFTSVDQRINTIHI